jgi:transposase
MQIAVVGLDLAKNVFRVHGVDDLGQAVLNRKLRRSELLPFFAGLKPALVGIEACHMAHYRGREIAALGHEVRLMPPQFVKPYVKSQKNDAADIIALAIHYGRYGYRRITALLRNAGWMVNVKRVERVWRREGLKVPAKQPKRKRLWLNDGSCIRPRPKLRTMSGPTTSSRIAPMTDANIAC